MDVMMPRLDGIETTRALRTAGNDVPILVLTARDAVGDRVEGLDAGRRRLPDQAVRAAGAAGPAAGAAAPGRPARGRAPTRRSRSPTCPWTSPPARSGAGDRLIELTRTEFTLLEMFLRRPRRVLERSFILEEVWGYDFPTTANSLEVYVGYLRRKTEAEGEPRLIHTVRGVGYVLKES